MALRGKQDLREKGEVSDVTVSEVPPPLQVVSLVPCFFLTSGWRTSTVADLNLVAFLVLWGGSRGHSRVFVSLVDPFGLQRE